MSPVILVDINSVGFAAQARKNRLHAGPIETTAIFGVLHSLRSLRQNFSGQLVVLWDGRSWRYDSYPEYKGNREANPQMTELRQAWRIQRVLVGRMLKTLGVHQIIATNLEADDLAARMRRIYRSKGSEVVLVSGDKDWLQLLETGVVAWDHVRDRLVTMENFKELMSLPTPLSLAEFKSLQGDSSDNIKGVGGIGPKTALALLGEFGTVRGFVNAMMADPEARKIADRRAIKLMDPERMDAFDRNMSLIWLDDPRMPKPLGLKVIKGAFDAVAFRTFCEDHAFHTVLRDMPQWIKSFSREDK